MNQVIVFRHEGVGIGMYKTSCRRRRAGHGFYELQVWLAPENPETAEIEDGCFRVIRDVVWRDSVYHHGLV